MSAGERSHKCKPGQRPAFLFWKPRGTWHVPSARMVSLRALGWRCSDRLIFDQEYLALPSPQVWNPMWPCDFRSVTKAVDLWLEVMSVTSRQKVSDGVRGSALSLLCCDHQECPT